MYSQLNRNSASEPMEGLYGGGVVAHRKEEARYILKLNKALQVTSIPAHAAK